MIIKYCNDIEYFLELHGSDEESLYEISIQYDFVFPIMQIGEHVKRYHLSSEKSIMKWTGKA
jgi:hypothetical protein